jgi:hypothetical protein
VARSGCDVQRRGLAAVGGHAGVSGPEGSGGGVRLQYAPSAQIGRSVDIQGRNVLLIVTVRARRPRHGSLPPLSGLVAPGGAERERWAENRFSAHVSHSLSYSGLKKAAAQRSTPVRVAFITVAMSTGVTEYRAFRRAQGLVDLSRVHGNSDVLRRHGAPPAGIEPAT